MLRRFISVLSVFAVMAAAALVASGPAQAAFVPVPPTPNAGMGTNGIVRAVLLRDGVAYAGGEFTTVTGTNGTFNRNRLAAWDLATGQVVTSFTANADGTVRALALNGGSLYVGGDFRNIGGLARGRLAEVDAATGVVNTAFSNNATGAVRALAVGGGRLFVGGSFNGVNSFNRSRLAAVDMTTRQLVAGFTPVADAPVFSLAATPAGDRVYAGGSFLTLNGQSTPYLAAVDFNGQSAGPNFTRPSTTYNGLALELNPDGSRLYVAHGGWYNSAAAYNTTTGARLWRQQAQGDVQAVAYHAGNVYFSFHESFAGDATVRMLAADAQTGALEQAFRPAINSFYGVWSIDASDIGVVAGGEFTRVNSVVANRFTYFDAARGPVPPLELVPMGAQWRYFDGAATPAGWNTADFDDTTWAQGAAELGYGDGDEVTVIGYGGVANRKYITSYFRHKFEWDASRTFTNLTLRLLADDGAAVYVNGQELLRTNLPAGQLTSTTRASTDRSGTVERTVQTFTVPATVLQQGTNTIAVELHQFGPGSSDVSMNLGIIGNSQ